jgi:hypothetical protein
MTPTARAHPAEKHPSPSVQGGALASRARESVTRRVRVMCLHRGGREDACGMHVRLTSGSVVSAVS